MSKIIIITCLLFFAVSAQAQSNVNWINWDKVPVAMKTDLKKFHYFKEQTLYDYIIETMEEGCTAKVAGADLDQDGQTGYIVEFDGRFCCGNRGCSYLFFDKKGWKQLHVTLDSEDFKLVKNGIISMQGSRFQLQTVTK